MARLSHGQRPAPTWTVAQKPQPMAHVVRLGRPANDNFRRTRHLPQLLFMAVAAALALLAVANWS